ncbi:unnamed protein product [Coregonus sp. 'balchen']|nr:unnamed protein product [Coregonus sp. 'balchen']
MFGTTVNLGISQSIVPAQRALFIWVKRNIKVIIYCGLFVESQLFLFDAAVNISVVFLINASGTNSTPQRMTLLLAQMDCVTQGGMSLCENDLCHERERKPLFLSPTAESDEGHHHFLCALWIFTDFFSWKPSPIMTP